MLIWRDIYYIPLEIKEISMPVLNVGPWGKDLHKYTERVNKDDLFYFFIFLFYFYSIIIYLIF